MKKLIPIIAAVVLLGGGAGAYFFLFAGGKPAKKVSPQAAENLVVKKARTLMKQREKDRVPGPTVMIGQPDFVVNLHDPGFAHFAKFDVAMEVDSMTPVVKATDPTAGSVLTDEPQIRDIINTDVLTYTAAELASPKGRVQLKKRIMSDVAADTDTLPLKLYFTFFAIQ